MHIGKFEVDVVKARQIENGLKGGGRLIDLGITHVVNNQAQVRIATGDDRDLFGLGGVEHYLAIENLGACRLSVARYVVGSKGVADPELILYLDYQADSGAIGQYDARWMPIERVQRLGGWAIFAQTDANGNIVNQFDAQGQRDLAEFAETVFLFELLNQGWLSEGQRSYLPKPYLTEDEQWARGIAYPYNAVVATGVSELMQKVTLRLATDSEVDLLAPAAQLTLTLPRRPIQLQLRKLDHDRVAITRYVVDEVGNLALILTWCFGFKPKAHGNPKSCSIHPLIGMTMCGPCRQGIGKSIRRRARLTWCALPSIGRSVWLRKAGSNRGSLYLQNSVSCR
jgi:hypothetical protein